MVLREFFEKFWRYMLLSISCSFYFKLAMVLEKPKKTPKPKTNNLFFDNILIVIFFFSQKSSFGHHDHPWMTSIAVVPVRFNRFTMYDMRRLHNIYYADGDGALLANNPEEGRLAINTFIYSGSEQFRKCSKLQISPEGCLLCLSTPGCAWVKTSRNGVEGKCFPTDHARRRHGRGK